MNEELKKEAREYAKLQYLSFDRYIPIKDVEKFIDKATLAERKRCAKIVECFMPKKEHWSNEGVTHFLEIIAKAITNNDNE